MKSTKKLLSERFSETFTWTTSRTPQEAIEIYQKVRDILIKGGFNLMKWITSDDEVKSQIPETDRSTKVVKTFDAEPQSSSILGLNWNVIADSLIVCRRIEQEVTAKLSQRFVLSFVSAVFDPLGICSPFTMRMRFLLKSIWAAMGQAWTKSGQQSTQNCSVIGALI